MNLIELNDRIIDGNGTVVYFTDSLIELLYNGEIPSEILFPYEDEDVTLFNKYAFENYDDLEYKLPDKLLSHTDRKNIWFYPDEYDRIDLEDYFDNLLIKKNIMSDITKNRVSMELQLYDIKGFDKFLRCCIFLSDKIKENNWVVGVGRGSSCASYCLFLLELHLVDSIKYNLDIEEFLK